jgi:hypothetical protein
MELLGLRVTSGWNTRRCWAIPDGICTPAIYMLRFPVGYPRMDVHGIWVILDGIYCKSWATTDGVHPAAIIMLLFPLGYLKMRSIEKMGHDGWNQD